MKKALNKNIYISKELKSQHDWAQEQLDKILPFLKNARANMKGWNMNDVGIYNNMHEYAIKLVGILDGWLSIEENEWCYNSYNNSIYAC